jgi:hypothetical protein
MAKKSISQKRPVAGKTSKSGSGMSRGSVNPSEQDDDTSLHSSIRE